MDYKHLLLVIAFVIAVIFIVYPSGAVPTTQAATSVTSTGATLNGLTDIAGDYWFEYSTVSSGYTMATETQAKGAGVAISATVDGIPIVPGTTTYFRLSRSGSNGAQLSFTTSHITPVPTTTYEEEYFEPFVEAKWNMSELAEVVPNVYFERFGYLIWAIFWGAIMMAFWVRQEDVTIPAFTYLIVFSILSLEDWLPSSFVVVSYVFAAISIGAIMYPIYRGRKHG